MSLIQPRRAEHIIFGPDDWDTLKNLRADYEEARAIAERPESLRNQLAHEVVDPERLWEEYAAAAEEAAERGIKVVLNDIGSGRWRDLVAEHPPQPGNEMDVAYGYNPLTFLPALLRYRDEHRRTIVEPEFTTDDDLADFVADIPDGDFEVIANKALIINRIAGADPKDERPLSGRRGSAAT